MGFGLAQFTAGLKAPPPQEGGQLCMPNIRWVQPELPALVQSCLPVHLLGLRPSAGENPSVAGLGTGAVQGVLANQALNHREPNSQHWFRGPGSRSTYLVQHLVLSIVLILIENIFALWEQVQDRIAVWFE